MNMAEFFESVGRAVRDDDGKTAEDIRNRNNFTHAIRFAFGVNYVNQNGNTPYDFARKNDANLTKLVDNTTPVE